MDKTTRDLRAERDAGLCCVAHSEFLSYCRQASPASESCQAKLAVTLVPRGPRPHDFSPRLLERARKAGLATTG